MKTNHYITLFTLLGTCLFVPLAHAVDTERFANCSQVYAQQDTLKTDLSDEFRLGQIQSLTQDIELLINQLKKKISSNDHFALKKCLDRKKQILAVHIQKVSETERTKTRYNKLLAKLNQILERHDEALRYYKLAAKYDRQDYEAHFEGFNSWISVVYQKIMSSGAQMSIKEVQDLIRESDEFILPIWNNTMAPVAVRIKVLERRAEFLEARDRQAEAHQDWKKILGVDPLNKNAMLKVADFEFTRGRRDEAKALYQKITSKYPGNKLAMQRLIEIGLESGDNAATLTHTKNAYEQNPKSAKVAALYAKALILNSRTDEARKVNDQALKTDPNNVLAKNNQGLILETDGDQAQKEKLPSKALLAYSQALKLLPNRVELRIKMASLLYQIRKAQNFEPQEIVKKDMDEAVRLLHPAFKEKVVPEEIILLQILTGAKSSKPANAKIGCVRYEKDFGLMPNMETLGACVNAYKLGSDTGSARKLVDRALSDSRFKSSLHELTKLMERL